MCVGGGCFVLDFFVYLFVSLKKKIYLLFRIPNTETAPCLFKNLEDRSKRQTGLITILNCRTLTSDYMAVVGRRYQVSNWNSDYKSKKTIICIVY